MKQNPSRRASSETDRAGEEGGHKAEKNKKYFHTIHEQLEVGGR